MARHGITPFAAARAVHPIHGVSASCTIWSINRSISSNAHTHASTLSASDRIEAKTRHSERCARAWAMLHPDNATRRSIPWDQGGRARSPNARARVALQRCVGARPCTAIAEQHLRTVTLVQVTRRRCTTSSVTNKVTDAVSARRPRCRPGDHRQPHTLTVYSARSSQCLFTEAFLPSTSMKRGCVQALNRYGMSCSSL